MEIFFTCQRYFRVINHRKTYRLFLIVIIALSTCSLPSLVLSYNRDSDPFMATTIKVIDGDTFQISRSGKEEVVRLWGIDSPEWDQPYSHKAKYLLEKHILDIEIVVRPFYYDKYGRLVAIVNSKGKNINQLLIERGLAWVHIYFCDQEICNTWKTIEKKARKKRIGLWSKSQPVPPWKWKHK